MAFLTSSLRHVVCFEVWVNLNNHFVHLLDSILSGFDPSITNEIQNLSYTPETGELSISGGGIGVLFPVMIGATALTDGVQGLVPTPLAGEESAFLRGDGTWANISGAADNWGTQVVQSDGTLTGDGTSSTPLSVVTMIGATASDSPSRSP